ncbi:MAG TPA: DUF4493 domain-containing protein [Candidatus Coprenecus stercoravium]|uniref:DUF4493 domain-containing protein n=1 Tax=Candidatus Coprenecus stercoravium TaxID=2840735 RepID=A0A9D2GRW7_9BACT|nr:DUF4493 domain-containing protein [Candidatus Coprenecus stercoravium]
MTHRLLKGIVLLAAAATALACKDEMKGDAYISFKLSPDYSRQNLSLMTEKILTENEKINLPDTGDFILSITGPGGEPVYKGSYNRRPEPLKVKAGSYDLSLYSTEFDKPGFSLPQFGDNRTVVAREGESIAVAFECTQQNCGIRLDFDESFINRFKNSEISISSEEHSLSYPYSENRTAFFLPGLIRVTCTENEVSTPILSRQLAAADMLTIKLSSSDDSQDSFSVIIDTSRNWISEDFKFGSGNDGSSIEKAISIGDLVLNYGAEEVWVTGYIVGGDVSSANVKLEPPFTKNTHVAIADSPGASTREECAAVELPSGSIRDAVNLIDNPELIGKRIYIKGDIENYFSHPGVKSTKEFLLD